MNLCDTSPLVALINKEDADHHRCLDTLDSFYGPLTTTAYCFTEAMYMAGRFGGWQGQAALWNLFESKRVLMYPYQESDLARMQVLMEQYQNVPMDLADASLVVAAETLNERRIFTLDKDFYIYRLPGNQAFEVIPGLGN